MPFQAPNYTQTPNDLFDEMLPQMGYAELKVTLAAIRITLGWHRDRSKLSLKKMMEATGLSKQAVLDGAEQAEKRGTLSRSSDGGETEWVVYLLDHPGLPTRPHVVKQVDHPIPIKETEKKRKETIPAGAAAVSQDVLSVYQSNIGLPTPVILDDLETAERTYSAEWVIEALKETARARVKRLSYTLKILENWRINGYKADRPSFQGTAPAVNKGNLMSMVFEEMDKNNGNPTRA